LKGQETRLSARPKAPRTVGPENGGNRTVAIGRNDAARLVSEMADSGAQISVEANETGRSLADPGFNPLTGPGRAAYASLAGPSGDVKRMGRRGGRW